jgi:Gpi18-like mannosyltransferase
VRDDGVHAVAAAAVGFGSRFGRRRDSATSFLGWDAQWYWFVADTGYPRPSADRQRAVAENQWAFMPVYAYLAKLRLRCRSAVSGRGRAGLVVAGYAACLVLYRMMRTRRTRRAMWAVAFFAAAPLAALFQVGYAESLFLLWLFLALWCVMRAATAGCTC